jgi:hypothetical protein
VPLSPVMNTVDGVAARRGTMSRMRRIAGLEPMKLGTSCVFASVAPAPRSFSRMSLRSATLKGFDRYSAAPARSASIACCGVVWAVMMMKGVMTC